MFTLLSLTMLAETIAIVPVHVHLVTQNMWTVVNSPYTGVNVMHLYFCRLLASVLRLKRGYTVS